jgi:hypothetical protein
MSAGRGGAIGASRPPDPASFAQHPFIDTAITWPLAALFAIKSAVRRRKPEFLSRSAEPGCSLVDQSNP